MCLPVPSCSICAIGEGAFGSDVLVFWGDGYGGCLRVVRSIMQHHRQRIMMIEILAQRCVCSGVRGMEAVCVFSDLSEMLVSDLPGPRCSVRKQEYVVDEVSSWF